MICNKHRVQSWVARPKTVSAKIVSSKLRIGNIKPENRYTVFTKLFLLKFLFGKSFLYELKWDDCICDNVNMLHADYHIYLAQIGK